MASASSNIIFDDIFAVEDIDRAGKKFDRGSFAAYIQRARAQSR